MQIKKEMESDSQKILLAADLHIHTLASGHAYSSLEEICSVAAAKGLELIAIADHGPAMPGSSHKYYFGNLRVLPSHISGVRVLSGVEANIINQSGEIDLPPFYLKILDLVWAGLHNPCIPPGTIEENTLALINALRNPYVDGIVHPGNPDYPVDAKEVVAEAQKQKKLIEINNSSSFVRRGSRDYCLKIISCVQKSDCMIAVNSDAHYSADVGEVTAAMELIEQSGIAKEQIINYRTDSVIEFIQRRKTLKNKL